MILLLYYYRRPIVDSLETYMFDRRPTYLIGDQSAWSDTDMLDRKPIIDQHVWTSTSDGSLMRHVGLRWCMSLSNEVCRSPIRFVGLQWGLSVSDEAYWYAMGLRSDMSVTHGSPMGLWWDSAQTCRSPMVLRWVSDGITIIFFWTHFLL